MSLLKLKEDVYKIYNYKEINKKLKEVSEADIMDDGAIAARQFKDQLQGNEIKDKLQKKMVIYKDASTELDLPSMQKYLNTIKLKNDG